MKESLKADEVLIFPNPEKEFIVETDASDFAVGCILSQVSDTDNLLHPVVFHSISLNKAEVIYTIYDKKLLAIITAFETWSYHLEGAKFPVQVIIDHKNFLYFKKPKHLNQRQIRVSFYQSLTIGLHSDQALKVANQMLFQDAQILNLILHLNHNL